MNRRSFMKKSVLGATVGANIPLLASGNSAPFISGFGTEGMTIVFQGDSITDAGRDKERQASNVSSGLGKGYAAFASAQLLASQPEKKWTCYNRGISGNKVHQLADRWKIDCLDLKPDVLSVLIGVNDFWHTLTHDYKGTAAVYEEDYRNLLKLTKSALPDVKLIVGEPFAVHGGTAIKSSEWYPEFDKYRKAAKKIANEFDAIWIPYQEIFDKALESAGVEYWCPDGVHPSLAGNYLMADSWLKALKKVA